MELKLKRIKQRLKEKERIHLFNDASLKKRIAYTNYSNDKEKFDFVINNNKTKEELYNQINSIIRIIK